MEYLIAFILGLILSAVVFFIIYNSRRQEMMKISQEIVAQMESQKIKDLEIIISRIKDAFGALSLEALSKNTQEFLKLASESFSRQSQLSSRELEEKKRLIDQTLDMMKQELQKVQELVVNLEKDREKKFGELSNQLKFTAEQTSKLSEVTSKLQKVLGGSNVRGQWGERMADDILRILGFVEGVNYIKQTKMEKGGKRPDFTFLLPNNLKLNMDVKFPLDNYIKYIETDDESKKEQYKKQFIKDVNSRISEVSTRDYINPEDNTLDCVLVFIPNEQLFSFIMEHHFNVFDEAIKKKVILCSPFTLFAILSVIRQAIDNFNLERTADQILSLLGTFYKQWKEFLDSLEEMGKKIEKAQEEFHYLNTTRRNQLEKVLKKIDDLRKNKNIPEADLNENSQSLNDSD